MGRKADFGVCHCLPFLRMPLGGCGVAVGAEDGAEAEDSMVRGDCVVGNSRGERSLVLAACDWLVSVHKFIHRSFIREVPAVVPESFFFTIFGKITPQSTEPLQGPLSRLFTIPQHPRHAHIYKT